MIREKNMPVDDVMKSQLERTLYDEVKNMDPNERKRHLNSTTTLYFGHYLSGRNNKWLTWDFYSQTFKKYYYTN